MASTKQTSLANKVANSQLAQEVKVTRAEIIDLVIEETLQELRNELDNVRKQSKDLREMSYTLADAGIDPNNVTLELDPSYNSEGHRLSVHYKYVAGTSEKLDAHIKKYRELCDLDRKLGNQIYNIEKDRRAMKVEITKKILEGSEEGRTILSQLDALKDHVKKQFVKR